MNPYKQISLEQAIREAIIEADKGVFISSEAMHKWMNSWGTDNEAPRPKPDIFLKKS